MEEVICNSLRFLRKKLYVNEKRDRFRRSGEIELIRVLGNKKIRNKKIYLFSKYMN